MKAEWSLKKIELGYRYLSLFININCLTQLLSSYSFFFLGERMVSAAV